MYRGVSIRYHNTKLASGGKLAIHDSQYFLAGILLLFLLIGASSKRKYVNISTLRFIGYISYGLYLDHLLSFRIYDWIAYRYAAGAYGDNAQHKR